ncbi:MAG: tyrosine-type recombinase/integrase [Pseudonocardiaceae bacterium]
MPGSSTRSWPRWPVIRPRPWSTSCAPCDRSYVSPVAAGWSTRLCWRRSRRRSRLDRSGSRRCGTRADVTKVLEAIDRGNPCGKRDYAIILLITRLGLRGIDVKRLQFADFDWPGNRLSVVQAKTGHRVQLPLLKDVGWAVIDYLRSGRPQSDCPQVFLRHTAPIGPFADQDHLHQILVKHARAAHVPLGEKRRHGMHSLRHTLATRLKMSGVASGASFGKIRERPLPATSPFELDQGRLVEAPSHAS